MSNAEHLRRLGRYDIVRVLGKGAMGVVYEGVDPRLHRKVAIKTILKSALDADTAKEYSMRFVREAQAVARLSHPNIAQVYDFGEEGDIAYIVMEFIKGKELKNFFDANERFDIKDAVHIMSELCDALHFAHEAGIVHRDVKPANVMIDTTGKVKLADFGVARITDSASPDKTQAGTMVGTPAYMSPEQITGGSVDRRSDIFSAGIILYQFLTGEKPFTGSGAWTIAKKIIQDNPPAPSSINKGVSPLLDAVAFKALAKDVRKRYQTARDLMYALRAALEGRAEVDDSEAIVDSPPVSGPTSTTGSTESTFTGSRSTYGGTQEVELEFWRAIKDGNDPDDFELYVQQFPSGIYAALAKRKIARLQGTSPDSRESRDVKGREEERRELEEANRREAEVRNLLVSEKARLEGEMAKQKAEFEVRLASREAELQRKEVETEARISDDEYLDNTESNLHSTGLTNPADATSPRAGDGIADTEAKLLLQIGERRLRPKSPLNDDDTPAAGLSKDLTTANTVVRANRALPNRYEITRILGKGSMGVIYSGSDFELNRQVAIKMPRSDLLSQERVRAARLRARSEARTLARLNHPNIVTIHDICDTSGSFFLVLEHLSGKTVRKLLSEKWGWPIEKIVNLGVQVLDALSHIHENEIVHKDIKPSNLVIDERERPRIIDFGVASMSTFGKSHETGEFGTPGYMAPEQIDWESQTTDHRADIFSLGVVLYEIATGQRPFADPNQIVAKSKTVSFSPPSPSNIVGSFPQALSDTIMRAIEKDPDDRFQEASSFARSLQVAIPRT